ncbi:hypothetical protein [Rurimicrobium arvi]|uniref:Uncharacterized protein n=1 Tax=Rurimicrobium arvi TaxID=2049916 RepID=A0ABP8MTM5_9BACT
MKKILSGLVTVCLLLSTLFTSCKKDDKKNELVFTINGLSDQNYNGSSITLPLEIKYTSGNQEYVTMGVSGLPSGMTGTFSSQSGTPTFGTTLTLTPSGGVSTGSFIVTVTGTSTSGVKKSASMKLNVPYDCASAMTGNYFYRDLYDGVEMLNGHYIVSQSAANTLSFKEVGSSDHFEVVLNCDNNTCFVADDPTYKGVFSTSPRMITISAPPDGSTVLSFTQE